MKVQEIMRRRVGFCTPEMNLTAAAAEFSRNGCECLPVVGEGGNVIGTITARDIGNAVARRDEPSKVPVWEAMQHKLFTCSPEDDIHCALKTIRAQKIRELPVVDRNGVLAGILYVDDIVQKTGTQVSPGLTRKATAA
jgi:osmoprotectant transport system ATP-binding protein